MKMLSLFGNTYPFKKEIKAAGGRWNREMKLWSVPEAAHAALQEKINNAAPKRELSGRLWEKCPCCGQEPVYMSLGGLCAKCC